MDNPVRILIIGHQRSGTTLLRRLIEQHPEVKVIYHERRVVNKPKLLAKLRTKYKDVVWGDKVPWNSVSGNEVVSLSIKWAKAFGKNHRIVHIMRNPDGVKESNVKLKWLPASGLKRRVINSVSNVHSKLKHLNYKAIRLEDLTSEPEKILKDIYAFFGIEVNGRVLQKIIKGDPNSKKKSARGIIRSKRSPYKKYEDFIK